VAGYGRLTTFYYKRSIWRLKKWRPAPPALTLAAIVGLRRTLYPDAPPHRPVQITPAAAQSEVASVT
jgi:hypothetical protein